MKRLIGALAFAMALMSVSDVSAANAFRCVCAEYNHGKAGWNEFCFSEPTWGNHFVQCGNVYSLNIDFFTPTDDDCEVCEDPMGTYKYYPWFDYTEFVICGWTSNGGYVEIIGCAYGNNVYGTACYFNHCIFGTGIYKMTPCDVPL